MSGESLSKNSRTVVLTAVAALVVVAVAVGLAMSGAFSPSDEGAGQQAEGTTAEGTTAEGGAGSDAAPADADDAAAPSKDPRSGETPAAGKKAPPGASYTPAASGEELRPLSDPPAQSVWAVSPDSYDEGVELAIRFEPYGYGPDEYGTSVVAHVSAVESDYPAARVPELEGRNVILVMERARVETGGEYSGTVVTQLRGGKIIFVLESVDELGKE